MTAQLSPHTASCTSTILVTGGLGYIGSHIAASLISAGHTPILLDNLSNSSASVAEDIGRAAGQAVRWIEGDTRDKPLLDKLFAQHGFDSVIHCAGLKSVAESVAQPLRYYDNNVGGSISLLEATINAGVQTLVFSSSATVYGADAPIPYREDSPTGPINPYGHSKWMIEQLLRDAAAAHPLKVALLRYFNPAGAHPSGELCDAPRGVPNNLMPYLAQVASGQRPELPIYGNDYPTPDGTGVRDYVHVSDLAEGHLAALNTLNTRPPGVLTLNLGSGQGTSVLQLVAAFSAACGKPIPTRIHPRRAGDLAAYFADTSAANALLGWAATRSANDMCIDAWRAQQKREVARIGGAFCR